MVDEVAHKGCKDPVVAAVPEQVGDWHAALAVPAGEDTLVSVMLLVYSETRHVGVLGTHLWTKKVSRIRLA